MMNPFPLIQRTIEAHFALMEQEAPMTFDQTEQAYERRCEAEREGAPRWCGACRHYHEEPQDGNCPYVDGMMEEMG